MSRCFIALLFAWTMALAATPARAQWLTSFSNGMQTGYQRNKAWPEPFLMSDRAAAATPFAIMVANGWRRQNLLSDYHFNEETQQLNQSGEIKLRFILTQMQPQRRAVFVQRGLTPDVTAMRMAVVQHSAQNVVPPGMIAAVIESDLPNDGWPAEDVDAVARKWQSTRPDPRLKAVSGADSSSGGNN
ncbi:MAG TPA: hypothetical protein VHV08_13930 [Pirellulales bacterium]|nr:hypothetical protein [Pirellulales bacterium]